MTVRAAPGGRQWAFRILPAGLGVSPWRVSAAGTNARSTAPSVAANPAAPALPPGTRRRAGRPRRSRDHDGTRGGHRDDRRIEDLRRRGALVRAAPAHHPALELQRPAAVAHPHHPGGHLYHITSPDL